MFILSTCYHLGVDGFPVDHKKAGKIFQRASEQGSVILLHITTEVFSFTSRNNRT